MSKPLGKVSPKVVPNNSHENKNICHTQPPTPHGSHTPLLRAPSDSHISLSSLSGHSDFEEIFKDRAVRFLKSISTGPTLSNKLSQSPETLQLVPGDTDSYPLCTRTQEESVEIGKVQAWVTSGVIKKSYQHCLQITEFLPYPDRPWINLSEYPGRVIPSPIKDQMNIEFRELHPYLDTKLTLSQIVNLREDLIAQVCKAGDFDPVTLAIGFTCFDRLLNMNLVNKTNRKLYASVCVLLAFKFTEKTNLDEYKSSQKKLLDYLYHMDKHDLLTTRMIFETEFSVYSYLNFSMHLTYEEIRNHLEYIKSRLN